MECDGIKILGKDSSDSQTNDSYEPVLLKESIKWLTVSESVSEVNELRSDSITCWILYENGQICYKIVSMFCLAQNSAGNVDTHTHKIMSAVWVEAPGSLSVDEAW